MEKIIASPTKRFFVEMLTRDIELEDAILDLLDNCLDGVLRHAGEVDEEDPKPYKRRWAQIELTKKKFAIVDNCGGIDRTDAETYAFRMGRPADHVDDELPTVGVYGIGMKRAIFKMGRSATITSHTSHDAFQVSIKPRWLLDDLDWHLPLEDVERESPSGTRIEVTDLYSNIAHLLGDKDFVERFKSRVATHYTVIIHKGFKVTVNGEDVEPAPIKFLMNLESQKRRGLAPYLYEGEFNDVEIKMVVGFYKPMPTEDELDEEQDTRRSKDDAGWTIICNDRVVVYCDKNRLTGWGEANVPGFHSQFRTIAGIVEFRSNHADRLPVQTTKRGIDAASELYLFAKNYMRDGTKLFTNYTNRWKHYAQQEREQVRDAPALEPSEIRKQIPKNDWKQIHKHRLKEKQFVPDLPMPPSKTTVSAIRFSKPTAQLRRVSGFLFDGDKDQKPADVGAAAFDRVHSEAKE